MYLDRTVFWLMTLSVEGLMGEVYFLGMVNVVGLVGIMGMLVLVCLVDVIDLAGCDGYEH